jgi:hypothetical protein
VKCVPETLAIESQNRPNLEYITAVVFYFTYNACSVRLKCRVYVKGDGAGKCGPFFDRIVESKTARAIELKLSAFCIHPTKIYLF